MRLINFSAFSSGGSAHVLVPPPQCHAALLSWADIQRLRAVPPAPAQLRAPCGTSWGPAHVCPSGVTWRLPCWRCVTLELEFPTHQWNVNTSWCCGLVTFKVPTHLIMCPCVWQAQVSCFNHLKPLWLFLTLPHAAETCFIYCFVVQEAAEAVTCNSAAHSC